MCRAWTVNQYNLGTNFPSKLGQFTFSMPELDHYKIKIITVLCKDNYCFSCQGNCYICVHTYIKY